MNQELQQLYELIKSRKASDAERQQFLALLARPELADQARQILAEHIERTEGDESLPGMDADRLLLIGQSIMMVDKENAAIPLKMIPARPVHTMRRYIWIAASLLALIGVAAWLLLFNVSTGTKEVTKAENILPGTNGAILTLADGKQLVLDSVGNGILVNENGTTVAMHAGELSYKQTTQEKSNAIVYNTLSTPAGRQFTLVLPDGTKVWLNAATSLRYPVRFAGNERTVSVTGEAYFEVTKNKDKPFRVFVNDMEVKVLGTHFNVNAYADEPARTTTLLEGKVEVIQNNSSHLLNPGQEAVLNTTTQQISVKNAADPTASVAWKEGVFEFRQSDIETIMRQVGRWYNVDVQYKYKTTGTFSATIQRNEQLPDLLRLLESTTHVHFAIKGRTVTVLQ